MAKKKSSPSVSFETYSVLFRYFLGEIGTTELKVWVTSSTALNMKDWMKMAILIFIIT